MLAQLSAVHGGELNLRQDTRYDKAALMAPVLPQVPWRRGEFNDFERPVRFGLLPGADRRLRTTPTGASLGQVDHEITNRGPYDTVFGWRVLEMEFREGSEPGE